MAARRKIVVAGGTGFLGRAVTTALVGRGDDVVVLSRRADAEVVPGARMATWSGAGPGPWAAELDGASAVVNLTGLSIGSRPTPRNRRRLVTSRVEPIAALAAGVAAATDPPPVWVQIAAVGVFGDAGDQVLDETTMPSGLGPPELVRTCLAWEHAFEHAAATVERPVLLRLGAVVGPGDQLSSTLAQLARLGLGGRAGSGRQWVSWVAVDDVVAAVTRALDDTSMRQTYHVTSPNPVTNREMMATVRRLVGRRFGPPAPAFAVRIGAWLYGAAPSLVLASQRAVPRRLTDAGFEFAVSDFETAARRALESGS